MQSEASSLASRKAMARVVSAVMLSARVSCAAADQTVQPIPALPPISVGAGLQTSIYDCDKSCIYSPSTVSAGDSSVQGIAVDSIRLYISGSVTDTLKLTFNTDYTGSGSGPGDNKVEVMDAIGRFEYNNHFNIWAGRFLPPSDRATFYGPYYANDWAPYADGVAGFYPDVAQGRDNGLAYWGDLGMLKVQVGVFDGETVNSAVADKSKLVYAGRLTMDFWDKETGYYLNGTYYGDKDLLAIGVAAQSQDSKTTASVDALMEKKLPNLGVITTEAEYNRDNRLTSASSSSRPSSMRATTGSTSTRRSSRFSTTTSSPRSLPWGGSRPATRTGGSAWSTSSSPRATSTASRRSTRWSSTTTPRTPTSSRGTRSSIRSS